MPEAPAHKYEERQLSFGSVSLFKHITDKDGKPIDMPVRIAANDFLYATDLAGVLSNKPQNEAREVVTLEPATG